MMKMPAHKIAASLAAAFLLVALAVAGSFWAFSQINAATEARDHSRLVIGRANELLSALRDAETGQRGYSLTGDEAFLAPYLAVRDSVTGQLEELRHLTLSGTSRTHLDTLAPLIKERLAELVYVIGLRRNHDMAAVVKAVSSGRGKRLMDSIRVEIGRFIEGEGTVLAQHDAEFRSDMRRLLIILIAAGACTLLFALLYSFVIYRETQRRVKSLVRLETEHLVDAQQEMIVQLHQTNDTLQISEAKLSVTLNSIGDAVIATDSTGLVTLLNPIAEHLTGWTQAEAKGRPVGEIFRIINQETREPSTIPVQEVLAHGTIQGLANHTILIARDQSERPIADSCAPIRDHDGHVVGAVLVFRDVTEEYATQQVSRDSAALVQTILNTVVDGIISLRASDGIIETANPAAEQMFGYTSDELIGHHISKLIPELDRDQRSGSFENLGSSDEAWSIGLGREVVGWRKGLGTFPIEMVIGEMWQGGHRHFTGIFRDITARKQVAAELLKAGALQSAIFNSANFSSIATDANGVIQIFNVGAERMLGYSAADVMNKITPADISDPQEVIARAEALSVELGTLIAPGFEALVFKASRGIEDIYELTYIRKDGSRFPAVVSVTALRDAEGTIIGYLLIGTDNTARKQAESALLEAGALQAAIFNSANFSSIATDANGVIQIFNVGAERMLGYAAADVMNKITPADISDPLEVIARAKALSVELGTLIAPGFEALVFKASRGIEDIYELTYIRKDGTRFPAVVSVTALRDAQGGIIGYLLIGTDNSARKWAEEALLKAGALQTAIFNSANFSSIATDARGVIQIFNVGAERMLGYKASEVMNRITPADISDPQEVIARAEALSVELATPIAPGFEALVFKASRGIEDIYELTYIRRDGSRFPAIVSVTALRDNENNIIGYLLIGTDNTARKRAEEALLKAGALQNAIFNSANFSSIATDANGVIQIFNVGAERMLGYAASEVMNKITPADISDPQEVIARAKALSIELATPIAPGFDALVFKASRGIEDIYELTYIRKDGSRFPAIVSVTALRDSENKIIGYLLIGTDNSARKQVEERLRWTEESFRLMVESVSDYAIVMLDPDGLVVSWNSGAQRIKGYTAEEIVGQHFSRFYLREDIEQGRPQKDLETAKAKGRFKDEGWRARKDGSAFWANVVYTAIRDQAGQLRGFAKLTRDLTERRKVEAELTNAKSAAEKANLAKSEFLSSMSHELRSPLNAILGFAQLMDSDSPPATPSQKSSIDQILHAGWYLLELINEILDLAVIESGKLSLSEEPVSLADVMLECQTMIEPQGQKRGITLTFPRVENPWFVLADRTRLKKVFINLLSNAIKYNRQGGSVVVEYTRIKPQRTRISVSDSGAGLPPEKLANLFQPFNRLGRENGAEEGTGIGLVMSKRVVELMGGVMGVESTVGMGSVFWFELNSAVAPQVVLDISEPAAAARAQDQTGAALRTLLYVEDNPANLDLVKQLIARRPDIRMLSAANGTLGIELARSNLPEVILMDINLPGISGLEALKILQDDPHTSHIPVLALSANAMPRDIAKGLEAGFFRYLTKPIKVNEFMDTLDVALDFAEQNRLTGTTMAIS